MTNHTPTPWKVSNAPGVVIINEEMYQRHIATMGINGIPNLQEINAKHIVHCVNSHDELINCLIHSLLYIKSCEATGAGKEIAHRIEQAIKKAGKYD